MDTNPATSELTARLQSTDRMATGLIAMVRLQVFVIVVGGMTAAALTATVWKKLETAPSDVVERINEVEVSLHTELGDLANESRTERGVILEQVNQLGDRVQRLENSVIQTAH